MMDLNDKPAIVQSDRSILWETDGTAFSEARDCRASFAELVKSPEHIHTYQLTPLSLWNAAASGLTTTDILDCLAVHSNMEAPNARGGLAAA